MQTFTLFHTVKIALTVLKTYTGFSDRQPVEHLNGNIHYQMFCGIMIDPSFPITNNEIVSTTHNEMASRLDIDSLLEILASCQHCRSFGIRRPPNKYTIWKSLIFPARKEKRRFQGQRCLSSV